MTVESARIVLGPLINISSLGAAFTFFCASTNLPFYGCGLRLPNATTFKNFLHSLSEKNRSVIRLLILASSSRPVPPMAPPLTAPVVAPLGAFVALTAPNSGVSPCCPSQLCLTLGPLFSLCADGNTRFRRHTLGQRLGGQKRFIISHSEETKCRHESFWTLR